MASELGIGAAALRYQQMGYAVLPLERGGKKPHRMLPQHGGVHHASLDPGAVRYWWTQDRAANLGVATGLPSHLVVVDLDVKGRFAGPVSLGDMISRYQLDLGTDVPFADTPSGGQHMWYRWPQHWGPVPERPAVLPGVDVKGEGGLVVAAPSLLLHHPAVRPGEQAIPVPIPYLWRGGQCPCQAPQAPPWFPQWLAWRAPGSSDPVAAQAGGMAGPVLEELRKTGFPAGQRNAGLYRLACQRYRSLGSGAARQVLDEIRDVNDAGGQPLPHRELLVILESARRFVTGQEKEEDERNRQLLAWLER